MEIGKARRIVVIGDSHTQAIAHALHFTENSGADVSVRWLQNGTRGDLTIDDAAGLVASLDEGDVVAFSLLGTVHDLCGLLVADHRFELRPARPTIPHVASTRLFRPG